MFTNLLISVTTQNIQWLRQLETQPEKAETSFFNKLVTLWGERKTELTPKYEQTEQTQNSEGKSVNIPHTGTTLPLQPNELRAARYAGPYHPEKLKINCMRDIYMLMSSVSVF